MEENPLYCSCTEIPVIAPVVSAQDAVVVEGKGDIAVSKIITPNKTTYIVSYQEFQNPLIVVESNPIAEVGELVNFTWNVDIRIGSLPIALRELIPQTDPVTDISGLFSLSVVDEQSSESGFSQLYAVTATDEDGNETEHLIGVSFYNKVYFGYLYKDGVSFGQGLNADDIATMTATLSDGIKDTYGGFYSYSIPVSGTGLYLYWLYEVGSEAINKLELNGLTFPFIILPGTIDIINANNAEITTSYVVVRSANKFGASTQIIKMS